MSDEEQPKPLRRTLVVLSGTGLAVRRTVITDDQGRFQFSGLPAGQYGLTANKEGFVPRSFGSSLTARTGRGSPPPPAALLLRAGESRTITIRLPRGAVISGTVTDTDGQPIEGSSIVAWANRFDPGTGTRQLRPAASTAIATTDDRGNYRIFGLAAGTYVVSAQATTRFGLDGPVLRRSGSEGRRVATGPTYYPSTPDQAAATRISVAAGEERDGVDVQVQYAPTATITGVVVGAETAAQTDVPTFVALRRPNDPFVGWLASHSTGADGQFTFSGVPPGRYTVRAQSPALGGSSSGPMKWGAADVAVDGEDVENVTIQLLPTVSVSGKVVFDGATTPAAGAFRMSLPFSPAVPPGLASQNPSLQLFDDGRFTITGLVPGGYLLGPPGLAVRGLQTPIETPSVTSSGTLSGTSSGTSPGTLSGSWWVKSIVLDNHELLDAPLDISHDSRDAVVTLTDQASTVTGALKTASGDPIAGAPVLIFSADRTFWFVSSRRVVGVYTSAQGRYTIRNLPPGDYRAIVAQDLETGDWYDPDVLQRLLPAAVPFTIAGVEAKTIDLVIR